MKPISPANFRLMGALTAKPRAWRPAGATSLVAGSAVFGAPDPAQAFRELQNWYNNALTIDTIA